MRKGGGEALLLGYVVSGWGPLCALGSVSTSPMVEMGTGGMTAGARAARALPSLSADLGLAAGGALGRAAGGGVCCVHFLISLCSG